MNKINSEEFYNLLQEYRKSEKIDVILFYKKIKKYIHNAIEEEFKRRLGEVLPEEKEIIPRSVWILFNKGFNKAIEEIKENAKLK